jgi:hypothetical protein
MTTAVIAIAAAMTVCLEVGTKSVNLLNKGAFFNKYIIVKMLFNNLYVVPSFSS